MPSLPTPGGDRNAWGDELNEFLEVGHGSDGIPIALARTAAKTTSYQVLATDQVVFASSASGSVNVTLPSAASVTVGQSFSIIKTNIVNNNHVFVLTTSSQTINGMTSYRLSARGQCLSVVSDGANWQIMNGNDAVYVTSRDWYVGGQASASGEGRSPATAFLTFAEAAAVAQGGDTIHLCQNITETCVVHGTILDGHGYQISSPGAALDIIQVTADNSVVKNVQTLNTQTSWTGNALLMDSVNHCHIYDWSHDSQHAATSTTGGNGLFATHGEGNLLENCSLSKCNVGWNLAEEFSVNTFINVTATSCYRSLYFNGVYTKSIAAHSSSGGCVFIRFKATQNLNAWANSDYAIWMQNNQNSGGNPGSHVFIQCDWVESGTTEHILVDTNCIQNEFINHSVSGYFLCNGDQNSFVNPKGNTLEIAGTNNVVDGSNCNQTKFTGTNNELRGAYPAGNTGAGGGWQQYVIGAGNFVEQMKGYQLLTIGGGGVTPDISQADIFRVVLTSSGLTIATPNVYDQPATYFNQNGWEVTIIVNNGSGGAGGTITWGTTGPTYVFTNGAWSNPANGKSKLVRFKCDGTNYIEIARSVDY